MYLTIRYICTLHFYCQKRFWTKLGSGPKCFGVLCILGLHVHLVGVRFRIRVSTGGRVRVSLGGSFRVRVRGDVSLLCILDFFW